MNSIKLLFRSFLRALCYEERPLVIALIPALLSRRCHQRVRKVESADSLKVPVVHERAIHPMRAA